MDNVLKGKVSVVQQLRGTAYATGKDGKSAYEIAIANGFVGTETEWIASLKGDKGEPGEAGTSGKNGYSAAVFKTNEYIPQNTEASPTVSVSSLINSYGSNGTEFASAIVESICNNQGTGFVIDPYGSLAYIMPSRYPLDIDSFGVKFIMNLKGADGKDGTNGADGASGACSLILRTTEALTDSSSSVSIESILLGYGENYIPTLQNLMGYIFQWGGIPLLLDADNNMFLILGIANDGVNATVQYLTNLNGHTPVKGTDYFTAADKAELVSELKDELYNEISDLPNDETLIENVAEVVKTKVPLVKTAEQPEFANSTAEMTDPSKIYVMPDGYIYKGAVAENYNLLNINEAEYSMRLQDDAEGTVASTSTNAVTDWIPIEYGKYYSFTVLYNGVRLNALAGVGTVVSIIRMNIRLSDGSVVVYNRDSAEINSTKIEFEPLKISLTIPIENAVAVRIHFNVSNEDISSSSLLGAYEPMIVAGDTPQEAYSKSTTLSYINGGAGGSFEWTNTGLQYNLPSDYEERIISLETDMSSVKEDITSLKENTANPLSASPYYRDVNFGILPSAYYQSIAESYDNGFDRSTSYETFINAWKALVANHSGYVTETALGSASDGQTVYLYDFKPVRISNQAKSVPKIIIIMGQHGFEKSNIYGMYYFVDNLLNRWNQHPSLEYLRNHVELMIVPVLNTWGFDSLQYVNANGVSLNRNYDSNWVLYPDTTSEQYGGAEPFDQPETQIVRDLLNDNKDALLVVDFHTNGGASVAQYSHINYYGICKSTDNYYNRMLDAVAHNLSAISANFNLDYNLSQPNTLMGFLNHSDGIGLLRNWATDNNFVGVLVEGFNGFPNDTSFTGEVYKANEEIIVNWMITAMNYLKV